MHPCLSALRFRTYLVAAGGDVQCADRLYRWNIAASGAFYEVVGALEVPMRNAMHLQLTRWHQAHESDAGGWYDDPAGILNARSLDDIAAAINRVSRRGRAETPGRIVAELNFGFWRFLLASRYQNLLWTPCLRHAFPHLQPQSRRVAYEAISRINVLRNRLAHHEPIFSRDLRRDHDQILEVASWIHPSVEKWIRAVSRAETVLAQFPRSR